MIVRWLSAAAIVVSAALVGLVAWVAGLKGLANRAEAIILGFVVVVTAWLVAAAS